MGSSARLTTENDHQRSTRQHPVNHGHTDTLQIREKKRRRSSESGEPPNPSKDDSRSLRSKTGGSRLKSDLATYFGNFEEIITSAPQPPEYLLPKEPIRILNKPYKSALIHQVPNSNNIQSSSIKHYEPVDLANLAPLSLSTPMRDPLNDDVFLQIHRRAERREKQLRNIEKERAQHEKGQLESLLDSLQGPDWLKAMGITGVTDGARKEFEPKRDYFVREVRILLKKFATWREAEKRLQQEKESALFAGHGRGEDEDEEMESDDVDDDSSSKLPPPSDVDAWAARQLQTEAKSASKPQRPKTIRLEKKQSPAKPKPFTTFFATPHERAAALGSSRPGMRKAPLAFGHPVPLLPDIDFSPPQDLISKEALMVHARKKRRLNRQKNDDTE